MRLRILYILCLLLPLPLAAQVLLKQDGHLEHGYILTFAFPNDAQPLAKLLHKQDRSAIRQLRREQQEFISRLSRDLSHTDLVIRQNLWVKRSVSISISQRYLAQLKKLQYVQEVRRENRYRAVPQGVVTLPGTNDLVQQNLQQIDIAGLWAEGFRGQGVVVAILDSGIDMQHIDLADRWRAGTNSWFDPYGEHENPVDISGHGTAVASIVLGGDGSGSYIGVAPQAEWIAARVFNDKGDSNESAISAALQWLLDPDNDPDTDDYPDIVQNSWGLGGTEGACANPFSAELGALDALGIDLVFSVGNSGLSGSGPGGFSSYLTPAFDAHVISVGALQLDNQLLFSSSRGPDLCGSSVIPSVVAPGQDIKTADLTFNGLNVDNTSRHEGTSFSAPHVSGALALLRSQYISPDHLNYRNALFSTAIDLGVTGDDYDYGRGLIQASSAGTKLQQQATPLRPDEVNFSDAAYTFTESPDTVNTARVQIIRSGNTSNLATITVLSRDLSAKAGEDFVAVLESINFMPGEVKKTIEISLLDDQIGEPAEAFELVLTLNSNVNIGTHSSIKVTINDDDQSQIEETIGGGSINSNSLLFLVLLLLMRCFHGTKKNWLGILLCLSPIQLIMANEEGRSIYKEGRLQDGTIVTTYLNGLESNTPLPCANCHRDSGLGTSESGQTIPPVSWSLLTKEQPWKISARFKQIRNNHKKYNLSLFHRAVTSGINSAGKKLDPIMPRYVLNEKQTHSLQQYLSKLYPEPDPGVDSQVIYLATLIDDRLPVDQQQQHLQFLRGLVAMKNAKTRGELRRKQFAPVQKIPQYQSYKTWKLLEWHLPEDTSRWHEVLSKNYHQQAVFSILSPLVQNAYETVAMFCSSEKIPCLFAQGSGQFRGDYYNFVFRDETRQWQEYIRQLKRGTGGNIYYVDVDGEIRLLDKNRQAIPELNQSHIATLINNIDDLCKQKSVLLIKSSSDSTPHLLSTACDKPQNLKIKLVRSSSVDYKFIKKSASRISGKNICWVTDYSKVLQTNYRKLRVDALTSKFNINNANTEKLANSLFAFSLLSDSLHKLNGYFSRQYLMEVIEHMLNSFPNYTYYDKISGAPGQRYIVGILQEYCPDNMEAI